jgi:hypothetical protein
VPPPQAAAASSGRSAAFRRELSACLSAWSPQDLALMHALCEAEALLEVAVHALLQVGAWRRSAQALGCWPHYGRSARAQCSRGSHDSRKAASLKRSPPPGRKLRGFGF